MGAQTHGIPALHHKENDRSIACTESLGQLVHVSPAAGRDSIGKTTQAIQNKGDRLDLNQAGPPLRSSEQKVEAAIRMRHFPADRWVSGQRPNPVCSERLFYKLIGQPGVHRDPDSVRLHQAEVIASLALVAFPCDQ
jgi:hypothetical protein